MKYRCILAVTALLALVSCSPRTVKVQNGHFMIDGQVQYFVGVNMWHASRLAVSDPQRLKVGLDSLQDQNVKNIRIMLTDENWAGAEKTIIEMGKRGLSAVVCLNDGEVWDMGDVAMNHTRNIVNLLKNSNAIFSWEICDEPQIPVGEDGRCDTLAFIDKIQEFARYIKSLDPYHPVCVGSEGAHCFGGDMEMFKKMNDCKDIDYITMHIWPADWGWVNMSDPQGNAINTFNAITSYLMDHVAAANELQKPLVIDNFGFSKHEGFTLQGKANLNNRNKYFQFILSQVIHSIKRGEILAGCNFRGATGSADIPMEQYVLYPPDQDLKNLIDECNHVQNSSVTIFVPKREKTLTKSRAYKFNVNVSSTGQVVGMLRLTLTEPESDGSSPVLFSESKIFRLRNSHDKVTFDLTKVPAGRYQGNLSFVRQRETGKRDYQAVDPFIITIESE